MVFCTALLDGVVHLLDDVVVEASTQTAVRGDGYEQHALHIAFLGVDSFATVQRSAHVGEHRLELFSVRTHAGDRILSTSQLRRRHHFHGRGDLHRVLNRCNSFPYFLESASHGLCVLSRHFFGSSSEDALLLVAVLTVLQLLHRVRVL